MSEHYPLPETENIYDTQCPILYAMEIIGQKRKLPILWYIADKQVIRYNELKRKVVGITPTMLTKCLVKQEEKGLIHYTQYYTIPPKVEYRLTEQGKMLLPTLNALYTWAEQRMQDVHTEISLIEMP